MEQFKTLDDLRDYVKQLGREKRGQIYFFHGSKKMNIEDAYQAIAEAAIAKAGGSEWDKLIVEIEIFDRMASSVHWFINGDRRFQGFGRPSMQQKERALDAILHIRDDLIESTGERIWGMVFSLTKEGKFDISYSYEKPENYGG